MYVIDSFAWLELFGGTQKGEKVKGVFKENTGIATTAANYYEVYYRMEQKFGLAARKRAVRFIENNAQIIPIDNRIATGAAEIRLKEGLSAVDAFTLAAARMLNCKVVTGDKHFRDFTEVSMI